MKYSDEMDLQIGARIKFRGRPGEIVKIFSARYVYIRLDDGGFGEVSWGSIELYESPNELGKFPRLDIPRILKSEEE